MPVFDCVTVGLSLSPSDGHLLEYAAMLSKLKLFKKIQFLHVITLVTDGKSADQVRLEMQQSVTTHFKDLSTEFELTFDVRNGVRVDEVLAHIKDHPCDLFLLGHRNNRSGKRSLAKRLAMISPASVWMVPENVPCKLTRVLAPVDFSVHSADSLRVASTIAHEAGHKECLALHVFFDPSTIRYDEHNDEYRDNEHQAYADFVKPLNLPPIKIQPLFEEASNVTDAIMLVTKEEQCDLIVMSTRGRSNATSIILGSETLQTFSDSHVPVLAIKHQGAYINLFEFITSPKMWPGESPRTN